MKKPTPNPPESDADTTSPYASVDSKKLHEAADRALDYYLNPAARIMSSVHSASGRMGGSCTQAGNPGDRETRTTRRSPTHSRHN
jgi:hypothetical protein